jgi:hypothetical protein
VCQRQVDVMKAALAESQYGIDFNNRVTMPLNHRVVILNGNEPETSATEVQTGRLPLCSQIKDPFEKCQPDPVEEIAESGAFAMMLAALAVVHIL